MSKSIHDQLNLGKQDKATNRQFLDKKSTIKNLVKEFTPEELKQVSFVIKENTLGSAPRNASELWTACKVLFGFEWPTTACTDGNSAPFEWIYDYFFSKHTMMLTLASRGSGKTYGQAQVTYLKNNFSPNYDVVTAAAILNQSNVSKGYLANFYEDSVLKTGFLKAPSATTAIWKNNSKWAIATGSMRGISGLHPAQLNLDEIEFWDVLALEQTYAVPQDKNGYRKVWAGFSTRQRSFGGMSHMVNLAEAPNSPIKLYQWNVFETLQRCPSCLCIKGGQVVAKPEEKCFLWNDCKGEKATKSSGWFKREDAEHLKQSMTEEAWQTQYLCSKPSSHGLVLYNFEHTHARATNINNGNLLSLDYEPSLPLYVSHDPAESKTSFLVFFQIWDGRIVIIDELVDDECYTVDKVKVALEERILTKGYADPEFVIVDPHRSDAGVQWETGDYLGSGRNKRYNVSYPDMKENNMAKIEPGLELFRTLICNGSGERRFFVNPDSCPRLIQCIKEHHYKIGADNKLLDGATPSNDFKDGVDACRYALIWAVQRGLVGGTGVSVFTIF